MSFRSGAAALLLVSLPAVVSQGCTAPPPATNYAFANFTGAWYEIARIQTAGGNLIQQFCACTQIIYTPDAHPANASDVDVNNSCRFENPSGFWLNATSYLTDGGQNGGHWIERYFPGGPAASYNIILTGSDARGVQWAVEYDCSTGVLGANYCLHYLSRSPLGFDAALLASLIKETTVTMGLNPENRPLNMTMQEGCW
jgi:lipocalin